MVGILGGDNGEDVIRRCVEENTFRKLSGGRDEGKEDTGSFYRKGIVGDWKNAFGPDQNRIFNDLAGQLMADLGYGEEDGNG